MPSNSMYVASNGKISFICMAVWYSVVCMYHSFFLHLSVGGHLGCLCILASVHHVAVNVGVHASVWINVFAFLGCIPRSQIDVLHSSFTFGGFCF